MLTEKCCIKSIEKSKEFLGWMIKPNGYLADIGDTDGDRDGRLNYDDVVDGSRELDKDNGGLDKNLKYTRIQGIILVKATSKRNL